MKLLRVGSAGKEKPVILDKEENYRDLSNVIQDFNPDLSLQKTLRKPKEQISNWTGKAKTKFAKAFDELTTTGIKLNGRINDNTIILKAF